MATPVEAPACDVVAVVGSAGAVRAMERVLSELPADLHAAVVVVLHISPTYRSLLAEILARSTALAVKQAEDGDLLEPGHVYVAPPDSHLLVARDGRLHLDRSAVVHHVRPSADALLLSMAHEYGGRCLAIVLSGTGVDGAAGAAALHHAGGAVLAQDEATSEYFGMPGAAILAGAVDRTVSLDQLGDAVIAFAGEAS